MSTWMYQPYIGYDLVPTYKGKRNWLTTHVLYPQTEQVLRHLKIAGSITNVEAHMVLKVRSVSRRITELRDAGYRISKSWHTDTTGQKYIRYSLDA